MRELTEHEQKVLAHVVVDPQSWWEHANKPERKMDAEDALAAKIARHEAAYLTVKDIAGYKTRAGRDAEEAAYQKEQASLAAF